MFNYQIFICLIDYCDKQTLFNLINTNRYYKQYEYIFANKYGFSFNYDKFDENDEHQKEYLINKVNKIFDFEGDISALKELKSLTSIIFGKIFNRDISTLKDLKSLTSITFGQQAKLVTLKNL